MSRMVYLQQFIPFKDLAFQEFLSKLQLIEYYKVKSNFLSNMEICIYIVICQGKQKGKKITLKESNAYGKVLRSIENLFRYNLVVKLLQY
jgi:hypothetical protein